MRRIMVIVLALVAALGITASTASTATTETGVTATSIKIGGTFPLSGPASLYATIPVAMKAYFSYINARRGPDGKRGVYGRQIIWNYKDDGYTPPNSVTLTRQLVEQDNVFAVVGSLGTEVNLAIRPYLNSKKVPQMLVATGATTWGADWKTYPWTTGWQPAYQLEGKFYGQAIARNSPNAKIGVLYQNDDYGKDYIAGLEAGLGAKTSNIVDKEPFEVTAAERRVADREAEGERRDDLRDPRDAEEDGPGVRDRERAQVVAGRHLHELRLGDRHVPDAREGQRRRRPRQPDLQRAVREGPGEPDVGQRPGDEALQAGDGEVLPEGPRHRRAQPLRRRRRPRVRAAALRRRQEPDP